MRHFGEKLKIFGVESFAAYVFSRRICLLESSLYKMFPLLQPLSQLLLKWTDTEKLCKKWPEIFFEASHFSSGCQIGKSRRTMQSLSRALEHC